MSRAPQDSVRTSCEERHGFGVPVRAYALSKALVTALTRVLARAHAAHVRLNCCCPGWVATAMGAGVGRGRAPKTVAEGARLPVHLAFDADPDLSGCYWANESVREKGVGGVREW